MSIISPIAKAIKKEMSPRRGVGAVSGVASRASSVAASRMRKNNAKVMGSEGPKASTPRNQIKAPQVTGWVDPKNKKAYRRNLRNMASAIEKGIARGLNK